MTITEQIDKEIQGEKLFYERKSSYTKEESKLIIESVYLRMCSNVYYGSMISSFMPDLVNKIIPNVNEEEMEEEIMLIKASAEIFSGAKEEKVNEEADYGHFSAGVNYGITEPVNYFKTISNDAKRIEEILSSDWAGILYRSNTKFLITINLIFSRYPEFFNDQYIVCLNNIIHNMDKKTAGDKEHLKQYKKAEKKALKNIKEYCKERKKDCRVLLKSKKN